jgi:putative SOS response-associated peptidase YedK
MLTTEPGPDVAPFHNRQVAVLPPAAWRAWLDYSAPARDLLKPLPAGTLAVEAAPR